MNILDCGISIDEACHAIALFEKALDGKRVTKEEFITAIDNMVRASYNAEQEMARLGIESKASKQDG